MSPVVRLHPDERLMMPATRAICANSILFHANPPSSQQTSTKTSHNFKRKCDQIGESKNRNFSIGLPDRLCLYEIVTNRVTHQVSHAVEVHFLNDVRAVLVDRRHGHAEYFRNFHSVVSLRD